MGGVEHRRHPRWDLSLTIRYKDPYAKGFSLGKLLVPHLKDSTVNISISGLLFKTLKKYESGTRLQLKIDFPASDATVIADGEVLYARKDGDSYLTGVKFVSLQTETDDVLGEVFSQQFDQIKRLPHDKQAEARKRILDRLFIGLIQAETQSK